MNPFIVAALLSFTGLSNASTPSESAVVSTGEDKYVTAGDITTGDMRYGFFNGSTVAVIPLAERSDLEATRVELRELKRSVEAARMNDMREREALQNNLVQVLSAVFATLIAIIFGIELRIRRNAKETNEQLRDARENTIRSFIAAEGERRHTNKAINELMMERSERITREGEAAQLSDWVKQYRSFECRDHDSCALPLDHNKGEKEIWHQSRDGRRWATYSTFDPTVD